LFVLRGLVFRDSYTRGVVVRESKCLAGICCVHMILFCGIVTHFRPYWLGHFNGGPTFCDFLLWVPYSVVPFYERYEDFENSEDAA
jgi:hypothetical protein